MKKLMLLLFLSVFFIGCATQADWYAEDWAKMSVGEAKYKCKFEAEKATPLRGSTDNVFSLAFSRRDIFNSCMNAQGIFN